MELADRPQCSVVIVNYKTPGLCIDSVRSLAVEGKADVEVLLVDNASDDGSLDKLRSTIDVGAGSNVKLISSDVNAGFSAGNNIGINSSVGEFVLLLNSDTIVRPGAVELLVQTLRENPSVGMVSPRLEWPDGRPQNSCFRFHHPVQELIHAASTGFVTKLLRRFDLLLPLTSDCSSPEWVSFACVLVRRQVFEDVGLLDDGFFMYYEDVDYCRRVHAAGWHILSNPNARVVHLRGGSSKVKDATAQRKRLPRYFYESRARYYRKHFGSGGLLLANVCWQIGWGISLVRRMLSRSYVANVVEAQYRDIWIGFWRLTGSGQPRGK
ncbi:glycosyltransferase family 2 protein [bacterium]|nr:glycosyltransferase family 2 protein [bacterium]